MKDVTIEKNNNEVNEKGVNAMKNVNVTIKEIRKAYIAAIVLSAFDLCRINKEDITALKAVYDANTDRNDDDTTEIDENTADIVDKYKDDDITDCIVSNDPEANKINNKMMFDLWTKLDERAAEDDYDRDNLGTLVEHINDYINDEKAYCISENGTTEAVLGEFKGYVKAYAENGMDEKTIERVTDMLHAMRIEDAVIKYFEDYSTYNGDMEEIESDCGLEPGELEAFLG